MDGQITHSHWGHKVILLMFVCFCWHSIICSHSPIHNDEHMCLLAYGMCRRRNRACIHTTHHTCVSCKKEVHSARSLQHAVSTSFQCQTVQFFRYDQTDKQTHKWESGEEKRADQPNGLSKRGQFPLIDLSLTLSSCLICIAVRICLFVCVNFRSNQISIPRRTHRIGFVCVRKVHDCLFPADRWL